MKRLAPFSIVLGLLAAACTAQPVQPATSMPAATLPQPATATSPATLAPTVIATSTMTIDPMSSSIPTDVLALPAVAQARADLAARLGTQLESVAVVKVEAVTWPNGGLGCPQPGMAYADVLVEGLRIQLEYAGQRYDYHSGGSAAPFLCTQPVTDAPITPPAPET